MNKLLFKIASISKKAEISQNTKREVAHTATIFSAGLAGTAAATLAGKKLGWQNSAGKMIALGGAAALASDYAAVKANDYIDNKAHFKQACVSNKYLEKIVYTHKG